MRVLSERKKAAEWLRRNYVREEKKAAGFLLKQKKKRREWIDVRALRMKTALQKRINK